MLQNPKNTPVTLKMKDAELTHVHVSQNVPQRSPMEVEIDGAKTCQIQIAQSVPIGSPLTWNLVGDPGEPTMMKMTRVLSSTLNILKPVGQSGGNGGSDSPTHLSDKICSFSGTPVNQCELYLVGTCRRGLRCSGPQQQVRGCTA